MVVVVVGIAVRGCCWVEAGLGMGLGLGRTRRWREGRGTGMWREAGDGEGKEVAGSGGRRVSSDSGRGSTDAAVEGVIGQHSEHDDADDEGDGSHTHVEEGSNVYKEYESSQGHGARHGTEATRWDDDSHGSAAEHSRLHEEDYVGDHESSQGYGSDRQAGEDDVSTRRSEKESGEWRLTWGSLVQGREEDKGDTLPPGRVMLMERLCDMVQRLSSVRVGGGMEADVIEVLNAKVDEMEDLLVLAEESAEAEATADVGTQAEAEEGAEAETEAEAERASETGAQQAEARQEDAEAETEVEAESQEEQARPRDQGGSEPDSGRLSAMLSAPSVQTDNQGIRGLASPLPWLASSFRFSELELSPTQSQPELAAATNEALEAAKRAAQAQAEMAERVATEAEKLNLEFAQVVAKLQARKEESDHLHSLLIDRAEAAATRILDLEKEVCDLEDDIVANESELRHLRLKIRAVETLCHEFVPPDADPELFRSIENWKADWVLVRDRMLERKKDRRERRLRLHRAGCVINSLEERQAEEGSTLTSLGGLSMSVSMLGLGVGVGVGAGRSPRKAY
ncbi:hypothetical protein N658DRAFT_553150 [Parathielavia hyrcaniae]|uniref:Uncharacterized protein n=1 Tax=Parathielavia hyrcaniae TaxID=113614 RepID=A0AAN6T2S2_9PEZI|nr:hypothetical protein N658DRAFT_553150 [Parathielavia hyrcaniae]